MSLELRIDAFDYYADVWMFISSFDGQTESIFIDIAAFV